MAGSKSSEVCQERRVVCLRVRAHGVGALDVMGCTCVGILPILMPRMSTQHFSCLLFSLLLASAFSMLIAFAGMTVQGECVSLVRKYGVGALMRGFCDLDPAHVDATCSCLLFSCCWPLLPLGFEFSLYAHITQ